MEISWSEKNHMCTSEQQLNKQWNGRALLQPWWLGRRKWFNPDWTYKERLKFFYDWTECVHECSTTEDSNKWKTQKWLYNFTNTFCFFTVLKAHRHTQTFELSGISFSFFSLFPETQTKGYICICPFFVRHCYSEHRIWSVSPQETLLPSPTAPSLALLAQHRGHIKKTSS